MRGILVDRAKILTLYIFKYILNARRNHYTRRANLRSIIQDGSDDRPPTIGGGNTYYREDSIWKQRRFLQMEEARQSGYLKIAGLKHHNFL